MHITLREFIYSYHVCLSKVQVISVGGGGGGGNMGVPALETGKQLYK